MSKLFNGAGRKLVNRGHHAVYADTESFLAPIDVHKESKKSGKRMTLGSEGMFFNLGGDMDPIKLNMPADGMGIGTNMLNQDTKKADDGQDGPLGIQLDFQQWLPFAAPKYQISKDIKDYIIVPVIAVPSDLPNRNRIAFPLKQLLAFNPEMGCQAYRTWVGKPTYSEHKNDVIEEAYGVVADTSMVKLNGWAGGKIWKLLMLAAFDRSKYVERVAAIANGDINSYSMGAWVSEYTCSVCNAEVGRCQHVELRDTRASLTQVNDRLAFKNCGGIVGFELSTVENPAWVTAISDKIDTLE
jgi:hypothetical protein